MDGRKITCLLFIIVACAGCHHGPVPEFPNWTAGFDQTVPTREDSTNSYFEYCRAAEQAETGSGRYLDMVSFYPGQRISAMKATAAAMDKVETASATQCQFAFVPIEPFKAAPHQKGWRMIGRDLVWRIDESVQKEDYDDAVVAAKVATKFGFDISGGGATDASLGLAIADEARKAIAPAIDHMDAKQLGELADGISKALDAKPPLSQVIAHEHENMLVAVQTIQDAYKSERADDLSKELGPDANSAIEGLDDLHRKDYTDRPTYFSGFAAEADALCAWAASVAELPAIDRAAKPPPKLAPKRPWAKFSKEFFSSLTPLMQMNDATVARTRLLILESLILQQVKSTGQAPKDLSQFPENLKTDPYSGKAFVYGADGADYHVYSVGADFRDDGGDTDETYTQPDLRLEKPE